MDDKIRKNPQASNDLKDLPPKNLDKDFEANVKGGAEPAQIRTPKPVEPINDFR